MCRTSTLMALLVPPRGPRRIVCLTEEPAERGTTPALVLIVDDDESIRLVLGHVIELAGYRVVTAASAADALKALTEPPAVALLDYAMPGVDGVDLGTKLRALYPDVRVIIQSGSTLDPIIASQLRADEDGQVVSGGN